MPSYEYFCRTCDRTFEMLMSLPEHDHKEVQCPHCQGTDVTQVPTTFSAVTSKKS
jgi:putative FmdB family regulatory protein